MASTAELFKPDERGTALPVTVPPVSNDGGMVQMLERLATNKDVDVEKLSKLIDMHERLMASQAKAEFDAAFGAMQAELPVVTERGEIEVEGVVRSKYARYEDIIEIVRPILFQHGFGLRHKDVQVSDGKLKIIGILSHRAGHREEDEFECPPDTSGKKNNIQAIGSTRSYGQRYTTISLLNIVTRGTDDDGRSAGKKLPAASSSPDGYEDWWKSLTLAADKGMPVLTAAWNCSELAYRKYLTATNANGWASLKAQAGKVTS